MSSYGVVSPSASASASGPASASASISSSSWTACKTSGVPSWWTEGLVGRTVFNASFLVSNVLFCWRDCRLLDVIFGRDTAEWVSAAGLTVAASSFAVERSVEYRSAAEVVVALFL